MSGIVTGSKRIAFTGPVYVPAKTFTKVGTWFVTEEPTRVEQNRRAAQYHSVWNPSAQVHLHMTKTQIAALIFGGAFLRDTNHCGCPSGHVKA